MPECRDVPFSGTVPSASTLCIGGTWLLVAAPGFGGMFRDNLGGFGRGSLILALRQSTIYIVNPNGDQ
jgi:hypothetical protein